MVVIYFEGTWAFCGVRASNEPALAVSGVVSRFDLSFKRTMGRSFQLFEASKPSHFTCSCHTDIISSMGTHADMAVVVSQVQGRYCDEEPHA